MPKIKIERIDERKRKELRIPDQPRNQSGWSVWECPPSQFDWHYSEVEKAYIYEGRVKVKTAQEEVEIQKGDFVTFPKDLSCTWHVLEKIRKVYTFE